MQLTETIGVTAYIKIQNQLLHLKKSIKKPLQLLIETVFILIL
jgi:hypothetical protein